MESMATSGAITGVGTGRHRPRRSRDQRPHGEP